MGQAGGRDQDGQAAPRAAVTAGPRSAGRGSVGLHANVPGSDGDGSRPRERVYCIGDTYKVYIHRHAFRMERRQGACQRSEARD